MEKKHSTKREKNEPIDICVIGSGFVLVAVFALICFTAITLATALWNIKSIADLITMKTAVGMVITLAVALVLYFHILLTLFRKFRSLVKIH